MDGGEKPVLRNTHQPASARVETVVNLRGKQNVTDTRAGSWGLYSGEGSSGQGRHFRVGRGRFQLRRPLKVNY